MHIASVCKNSDNNSEDSKENNLPGVHKRTGSNGRSRLPTKFRTAKPRQRHNGTCQHHRLDHTYAANLKSNEVKTIVIDDDDDEDEPKTSVAEKESRQEEREDIGLKSSWLRNLCLKYQPAANGDSKTKSQRREDDDCTRERVVYVSFDGINGTLKQYQRNRKVEKRKTELPSSIFGRSKLYLEEKKRWIAALALIELAQSK